MKTDFTQFRKGSELLKRGFARMQQGGVIMDVVNPEQAAVAEDAGAVAVMALERVPADIRKAGGVARMSHPDMIQGILDCTSIPVMAKSRIGHDGESRILEAMGVDMIDESEVLTPADPYFHINKHEYEIPFVCGATGLGEAAPHLGRCRHDPNKGEAGTETLWPPSPTLGSSTRKFNRFNPWTTTVWTSPPRRSWNATVFSPHTPNSPVPTSSALRRH